MTAARLATVAAVLLLSSLYTPAANAQTLATTGKGLCRVCGHSELDTQRYVNSFLNQLFFLLEAQLHDPLSGLFMKLKEIG